MELLRIAVFYLSDELEIKDIEKELFTADKEKFQLFFFHNKNLHFSKDIIKYGTLLSKFEKIEPEFKFDKDEITMNKKMKIDMAKFDEEVDNEYNLYRARMTYRMDSIFQTFTLFDRLYRDRSIIFIFPFQLYENFISFAEDSAFSYKELEKDDNIIGHFDIFYWIDYFSKFTPNLQADNILNPENITKILKFEH